MRAKTFSFLAGIIFFLIALLHLSRIVAGWSIVVADWEVPLALNWVGLLVGGYLAYQGLTIGRGRS